MGDTGGECALGLGLCVCVYCETLEESVRLDSVCVCVCVCTVRHWRRVCTWIRSVCVCVLCMFLCSTSVVTCALVSPPQRPVGDRAAPSVSFVSQLPCLMPMHLLTRITAKEILCRIYRDARNCCHSVF